MSSSRGHKWSQDEHERFLQALEMYPRGSWKQRAEHVRTRSTRQVMTHAQKLTLKAKRHARGLQKAGRPPRKNGTKPEAKPKKLKHEAPNRQHRRRKTHYERKGKFPATPPQLSETPQRFVSMVESPAVHIDLLCLYPPVEYTEEVLSPLSPGTGTFFFNAGDHYPDDFDWDLVANV